MSSRGIIGSLFLLACSLPLPAQYFQTFPSVSNPVNAVFADVNGDGKADSIYVNDGLVVQLSGETTAMTYSLGTTSFSGATEAKLLVLDFNGDGKPDVIVPMGMALMCF